MDKDVEKVYTILVETNYPVSLEEVKNPTSECMIKVVLTFLSGFSIDGNTIQRATFGQEQNLSYSETYHEIISIINLHQVMVKICNQIFIKDFFITDLSSPGQKRARRLIGTLVNFVLYAQNKSEELIEPLNTILTRLNTLNEHVEKKDKNMQFRKDIVLENSKKSAHKEKYVKQIQEIKARLEKRNKAHATDEERAQNAKLTKEKEQQNHESIKQQLFKINENIAEMESTIVESPEEYEAQLANTGQQYAEKEEKLQTLVEKLRAKIELNSQFEKVKDFILHEHEKFSKVQDVHHKSVDLDKVQSEISKQLNEMQDKIQILREEVANPVNDDSDAIMVNEAQAQCQQHLAPQREMHNKLLSRNEEVQNKFEEASIRYQQSRTKRELLTKTITKLEEEIAHILKDYQDMYTSEIQKEIEIEKLWKERTPIIN
ncbi:kinetochore protein Nuf2 homolog [Neodiprion pinetum]|uniref:Probable kinetochore protein nuf2 n=1 Tax=Neodiprion lecontei TaxID=441921 RepID=A0A6J0C757_NEOLC|nr:probable kinetochore protein nuf2 [Neodiprion lecontei]XP_046469312.1 probable kinetochore protein nuf2 [Neodiprion pinetum]XP_046469313.1 probable kinetochore protein nuf2 [Neodiprion pinetum]XP_046588440.1 probable kinetochore protein nuf2 [Neodiprion lecontei]